MKYKLKTLLIAVWIAALLLTGGALSEAPQDEEIESILSNMTLEEKIGQMMIVSFRVWEEILTEQTEGTAEVEAVNITELNDEIRDCLAQYHFGGTVLFSENCQDTEQVVRLVSELQSVNKASGGLPLLVCADQEGGAVARLGFGTTGPGNMALAATGNSENAKTMAAIYGEELGLLGIQVDYAPVMDVNNNPNNPIIGVRSFSDSPEIVAEYGISYIEGLHSAGTIATLKHFPGHGNTDVDSHTGFPRIDLNYDDLKVFELVPFQAAVAAGADMVMTAHIQYPQIESKTYTSISTGDEVYLPATMSRTILTDILRNDMGFEGVIVSDALDMAAITENFSDEDVLRLTINSGVNMLILPPITDTDLFQKIKDTTDLAVKLAESGEIDMERVNDSVRRILTLKQKYGLLDQSDFSATNARVEAAVAGVGSAEHRAVAWEIAQSALTLVKNESEAFPINLQSEDKALILFADSCASRVGSGEWVVQMLEEQGELPDGAEIAVMVNNADNGDECAEIAEQTDHVILVNRVYNSACLNPNTGDGFSTAVFDRIIESRHAAGKTVIVVSCQLPYDAARFTNADALLLTYGSSPMRAIPAPSGTGSAYVPNLPAALCACFGVGEASGRLPVSIPALNSDYSISGEILYTIDN